MASSHAEQPAIPLHRGTYEPDFPRYVRPAPPELYLEVADLDEWLNRGAAPTGRLTRVEAAVCALVVFAIGFALAVL